MVTQTDALSFYKNTKVQIKIVDTLEDFQCVKNLVGPAGVFQVGHVEAFPLSVDRDSNLVVWDKGHNRLCTQ